MKQSDTNPGIPNDRPSVRRPRLALLPVSILILILTVQTGGMSKNPIRSGKTLSGRSNSLQRNASQPNQKCLHGGIEIGASGVKAIAIRVLNTDEGYDAMEIFSPRTANTVVIEGVEKTNKMSPEAIKDTAQVVNSFYKQMLEKGVPSEQIYIVGSSGLRAGNLVDLSNKVEEETGKKMTFLEVSDEVTYAIFGAVPKYVKSHSGKGRKRIAKVIDNRGRAIMIDVGSGNTKGGYQERISPTGPADYRVVTFGIPFGTRTLADRVSKSLPPESTDFTFAAKATDLGEELIGQALKSELERKPGLMNRQRVYLTGGIVWAMATLIHPGNRKPYVELEASDIDRFYNEALRNPAKLLNPDLSALDPDTRELAENDINSIRSTFTPKQLIAGAEILKNLSTELKLESPGKALRFVRKGYIAWILRYVNLRSVTANDGTCN